MTSPEPHRVLASIEAAIILAVQALLIAMIVLTLGTLASLLLFEGIGRVRNIASVVELQPLVLRAFGGTLLVFLGLELLESVRTFTVHHHVRLELILTVAAIAVGRHVILLDIEHANPMAIIGAAVLVLSLAGGYAIVRHSHRSANQDQAASGPIAPGIPGHHA